MRKEEILILFLGLALITAPAVGGGGPVETFSGSYDWKDGGSDELQAEFKPDGNGNWKVKFGFRFGGKRNNWKGKATGSLEDGGKISGTAGWSGRSWVFEGRVEDGILRGSHTEIRGDGTRYETGSFEMRR